MSVASLLLKEIRFRWLNFLLGLSAVAAAVALCVALLTLGKASENETRRLMRDMGFNLIIIPKDTNMERFWASDFADREMPQDYVQRLVDADTIQADHYVATLMKRVDWHGRQVFLKGVAKEQGKKSPMGFSRVAGPKHKMIPAGKAYVGFELWSNENIETGDTIEVLGKELEVIHCLFESGSKDDITLYADLSEVQDMLNLPGRINNIQALGCLCPGGTLEEIRAEMAKVLPEAKVSELTVIAQARSKTREMVSKHGELILLVVLVVCAAWVAVLSFLNVREREHEIGVLRALGHSSSRIAALFLGRAVIIGVVGALLGFAVGTVLSLQAGPDLFKITHAKIVPLYDLLAWSLLGSPLVAAAASFLPAMVAVTQDPAVTLVKE